MKVCVMIGNEVVEVEFDPATVLGWIDLTAPLLKVWGFDAHDEQISGAFVKRGPAVFDAAPWPEPDMSRMGEKHIKPCRGCGKLILWAKHEKPGGKVAPLIKTVAGETPNIMAWFDESQDRWIYKIKGAKSEVRGTPEYINHFANCSHANDFKSESPSEQEQQQASIK